MRHTIALNRPEKIVWTGFVQGTDLMRRVAVWPGVRIEVAPEYYLPRPANRPASIAEARRQAAAIGSPAVLVGGWRYETHGTGAWQLAAWEMAPTLEVGVAVGDDHYLFRYRPGDEPLIAEAVRQLCDGRPPLPDDAAGDLINQMQVHLCEQQAEALGAA